MPMTAARTVETATHVDAPFPLLAGERLLWASPIGGVGPSRITMELVVGAMTSLFVFAGLFAAKKLITTDARAVFMLVLMFLSLAGLLAILSAAWAIPRQRQTLFMTTQRLLTRSFSGALREIPLAEVRGTQRLVIEQRLRHGTYTLHTDCLLVRTDFGDLTFGPSLSIARVESLLQDGVLAKWIDLSSLPGLDGSGAAAHRKEGFFVCASSSSSRSPYGPLFVGPRVIARLTEANATVVDRLYTLLAGTDDGEAAERALLEVLRHPHAGHFVEYPRDGARISVEGRAVTVGSSEENTRTMILAEADARRLESYLAREVKPTTERLVLHDAFAGSAAPPAERSRPVPRGRTDAGPDLTDPTLLDSDARTLAFDRLEPRHRTELTAVLTSDRAIAFLPVRFAAEQRGLLLASAVGVGLVIVDFATRFGLPCSPREGAWASVVCALGLLPLGVTTVRYAELAVRRLTLPYTPGVYVFAREVVVARSRAIRCIPIAQVAAVSVTNVIGPLARMTFFVECEPTIVAYAPSATATDDARRIEAARDAASRGEVRRDPFAELRRTVLVDAPREPAEERTAAITAMGLALMLAIPAGVAIQFVRNAWSDARALAAAGSDPTKLRCYADHRGARAREVREVRIPHVAYRAAHAAGTTQALEEFLEDHPGAPDAARARAELEALDWAAANDALTLKGFLARHPDSSRAPEARRRLPVLALREAQATDTVGAYRAVAAEYVGTPEGTEAARLVHARYEAALGRLTPNVRDPRTADFLRRLFAYLEANGPIDVRVRFRRPSVDALEAIDALFEGEHVEPISPQFRGPAISAREVGVFERLHDGFAAVIAEDVLPLRHGQRLPERLDDDAIAARLAELEERGATPERLAALRERLVADRDPAAEAAEIRIDYVIVPTGSLYALESERGDAGARKFAGFRIVFTVELRISFDPERVTLRFAVEPPVSMDVRSDAVDTRSIYDLLCNAAFDQLGDELKRALLGEGG